MWILNHGGISSFPQSCHACGRVLISNLRVIVIRCQLALILMEKEALEFLIRLAWTFIAMAGLCSVGIALGIPAGRWIGNRIGHMLSGLSDAKFDAPCPLLGPAAAMAVRGDLNGAVDAYQKQLEDHPNEQEIYWRLLEILLGPLKDGERARAVLEQACENLDDESSRSAIVRLAADLDRGRYLPFGHLLGKDGRDPRAGTGRAMRIEPPRLKPVSPKPDGIIP